MHDYVVFHRSIDYCVELSLVGDNQCENCSHFTLKWVQLNSFEEMNFLDVLEESYKQMDKILILKNLRASSTRNYWLCL